jgi:hypothetical protein
MGSFARSLLSDQVLQELFSLDNLIPKARLNLEEAVKNFSTISLYDLHIISQFPAYLQEELAEEYKNHPTTSHSLAYSINKYTKQNQPTYTPTTSAFTPLSGEPQNPNLSLPEKFVTASPNEALCRWNTWKQQQKLETNPETTQTTMPDKFDLDSWDNSPDASSKTLDISKEFSALLLTAGFCCACGCLCRIHFKDKVQAKNLDVVVQNENEIFEHVDVKPRIFLVRCDNCNTAVEVRIDNPEASKVSFCCRKCSPVREGALDVSTGDAVWFG